MYEVTYDDYQTDFDVKKLQDKGYSNLTFLGGCSAAKKGQKRFRNTLYRDICLTERRARTRLLKLWKILTLCRLIPILAVYRFFGSFFSRRQSDKLQQLQKALAGADGEHETY